MSEKIHIHTKDYMLTGESFSIIKREGQSYLETENLPENLDKYYESDAYLSHQKTAKTFFEKIYQIVKSLNLKLKFKYIKVSKTDFKLLDIGAGTGDFLAYAKSKNLKVLGVEPNPNARQIAAEKNLKVYADLKEIENKKFDAISLWHVLEHIPNLKESLEKIDQLLNDGGQLIIAVPNYKSWDAKKYAEFWAAYDVPRHIWHFDRKAMQDLFPAHIKLKKTKPMCFDAFYVSMLSEKYKHGKVKWISAILNASYSNFKAIFTKEYSSIIYIYQKDAK